MSLISFINGDVSSFHQSVLEFVSAIGKYPEVMAKSQFKNDFIKLIQALGIYEEKYNENSSDITVESFKELVVAIEAIQKH